MELEIGSGINQNCKLIELIKKKKWKSEPNTANVSFLLVE